jgi:hypothetical protein
VTRRGGRCNTRHGRQPRPPRSGLGLAAPPPSPPRSRTPGPTRISAAQGGARCVQGGNGGNPGHHSLPSRLGPPVPPPPPQPSPPTHRPRPRHPAPARNQVVVTCASTTTSRTLADAGTRLAPPRGASALAGRSPERRDNARATSGRRPSALAPSSQPSGDLGEMQCLAGARWVTSGSRRTVRRLMGYPPCVPSALRMPTRRPEDHRTGHDAGATSRERSTGRRSSNLPMVRSEAATSEVKGREGGSRRAIQEPWWGGAMLPT